MCLFFLESAGIVNIRHITQSTKYTEHCCYSKCQFYSEMQSGGGMRDGELGIGIFFCNIQEWKKTHITKNCQNDMVQ